MYFNDMAKSYTMTAVQDIFLGQLKTLPIRSAYFRVERFLKKKIGHSASCATFFKDGVQHFSFKCCLRINLAQDLIKFGLSP